MIAFMGIETNAWKCYSFLSAERGKGVGKQLLQYGIENYGIQELTVNEQNPQAVGFYRHMGFKTYKRTDYDEEGNPYPLLYMKNIEKEHLKWFYILQELEKQLETAKVEVKRNLKRKMNWQKK